jgi:hypothetical protein
VPRYIFELSAEAAVVTLNRVASQIPAALPAVMARGGTATLLRTVKSLAMNTVTCKQKLAVSGWPIVFATHVTL